MSQGRKPAENREQNAASRRQVLLARFCLRVLSGNAGRTRAANRKDRRNLRRGSAGLELVTIRIASVFHTKQITHWIAGNERARSRRRFGPQAQVQLLSQILSPACLPSRSVAYGSVHSRHSDSSLEGEKLLIGRKNRWKVFTQRLLIVPRNIS